MDIVSQTQNNLSFVIQRNEKLPLILNLDYNSAFSIGGKIHGEIKWDVENKQLIYIPELDFTGELHLNLNGIKNGEPIRYTLQIVIANTFKPRARIIKIIGQELISSDVIALVELIKNSYDADAENIDIHLNNIFSSDGEIIIKDNGIGMTYEKVLNVWLEPATPDKRGNEGVYSKCFNRKSLGEKGIGRFAVHRLGEKIELITRGRESCDGLLHNYETEVSIDWSLFNEDKYLSDIPVSVKKNLVPKTFINDSGTLIRISTIKPWKDLKAVKEAVSKIRGLESPVKAKHVKLHLIDNLNDPGVSIDFKSNDDKVLKEIKEVKSLKDLLDTAFYKFYGIIDQNGNLLYDYSFDRVGYADIKREDLYISESLTSMDPDYFESRPLHEKNTPGIFEVSFYAWDLDTTALKVAGLKEYYKNVIKPNAGVRIYRDNFRVWPYGEPNDDWLGLDLKRLNEPKERTVSRNQVFGIVHISSTNNSDLKDQSNREGLIVNEQYENFYQLISGCLTVFGRERKKDKILIDNLTKSKSSLKDAVTESIDILRNEVLKRNHQDIYDESINAIETTYHHKINDILERYMMAAAIGISYTIPIHEMKLRLNSIKNVIDDLQKHPELQDKFLKKLGEYVNETDDIINAVTSIMSRQKKQKVSLYKVAQNTLILKEYDLKKHNIELEIIGDDKIQVEAVPGLLNTAVLNLVDNSIYWLRAKKIICRNSHQEFFPKIVISISKNPDGGAILSVRDNGEGFKDPFELLLEPYYSRKTDGLGLGLFLVNEIMVRLEGNLKGFNKNGAIVEMIFKK